MTDPVQSLATQVENIAKNDVLKGVVPVLDGFLTGLQANQGGNLGIALLVNALGPQLLAAIPNIGATVVKDSAGAAKTSLDAAAAEAEAKPVTAS